MDFPAVLVALGLVGMESLSRRASRKNASPELMEVYRTRLPVVLEANTRAKGAALGRKLLRTTGSVAEFRSTVKNLVARMEAKAPASAGGLADVYRQVTFVDALVRDRKEGRVSDEDVHELGWTLAGGPRWGIRDTSDLDFVMGLLRRQAPDTADLFLEGLDDARMDHP